MERAGELVCHVGVYARQAKWGDDTVRIGGIGGVITRQDSRKQGYASAAMGVAVAELRDKEGADFALLVCEPHNFGFYRRLGWRQFIGDLFAEQPEGRVRFDVMTPFVFDMRLSPQSGANDLQPPWRHRPRLARTHRLKPKSRTGRDRRARIAGPFDARKRQQPTDGDPRLHARQHPGAGASRWRRRGGGWLPADIGRRRELIGIALAALMQICA